MTRKVLLTGVTGFLGSHLAKDLLSAGYDVVGLKRQSSSLARIESIVSDIMLVDIDGLDFDSLFAQYSDIDYIVHTATNYGRNNESVSEIFNTNTVLPLKLLDAGCQAGVKFYINTDTILDQYLNLYSLSKNQLLQWGKFLSNRDKIMFINLRLEHIYGYNDDASKFTSYVINNCMANTLTLKLTPGEQKRDFIYIDDVVTAYLMILEKATDFENSFIEFDVGSGQSISIRSFVETVHHLTGSQTQLAFGAMPYRSGEVMHSQADTTGLRKFGWKCKYDLVAGISKVLLEERTRQ